MGKHDEVRKATEGLTGWMRHWEQRVHPHDLYNILQRLADDVALRVIPGQREQVVARAFKALTRRRRPKNTDLGEPF